MDQMTYDEAESESTGDSAYCDNVTDTLNVTRLHGKSFEVTERQGQSALVPGVNIHKTPAESVSKSFTNSYKTTTAVENSTKVHNPSSADHTTVMNGFPVQEMDRHRTQQSLPVYSIQGIRSFHSNDIPRDEENTPLLPPAVYQSKKNKWISYRCYFGICTLLIVGIVLLISLSSTLYVISTKPGSLQRNLIVNNDDTVLIDFFNIYSYKGIEIRQAKDSRCSDCKLEVYSFYPDNIIVDDHYFNISATNLTTTHDDVLLAPSYFVSGSKIRLSVKFLPLKAQNTTIEFLLFNNLSQYNTFQAGSRPIALQVYTMSVNEKNKREHSLEITIENTGYYFLGIRPTDSPVTFQFSVAVYQIFYSRNYFPAPICRLESTESCYIPFTVSFSDYYTDTLKKCVFVYSIPPPQVADSYYNTLEYEVYRSFWNSYSIALISLISLSALCVFTTCCYFLCFCLCTATRRRRRHKSVF